MASRKDIHRPSAIVPVDYAFVGLEVVRWEYSYHAIATGLVLQERARIRAHMDRTGGTYSTHQHKGNCMVCGAHCIYTALFYHEKTNSYIRTGMDCAAKMDMGDPERFRKLTDAIKAAQFARSGWKKAEGVLDQRGLGAVWDIFLKVQRPDSSTLEGSLQAAGLEGDEVARMALRDMWEEQGLDPNAQPVSWGKEEMTLVDIVSKLAKYGSLSERQYDYLGQLALNIIDRPAILAKKEAEERRRAEEKAKLPDCPEGRIDFTGTILKVEWKEDQYGGYSYGQPSGRFVCTVKSDEGWLVWGTLPSGCDGAEKGDRVEMRATLERSIKDRTFGFMRRPQGRITFRASEALLT